MINYEESADFKKDFKKLLKRFKSLSEDFAIVKKAVIELRHILNINNLSTFEIPGYSHNNCSFWKIKKFACKSLKGRGAKSGLRVIYHWQSITKKITFLEIYFKGDKENEDRNRMEKF